MTHLSIILMVILHTSKPWTFPLMNREGRNENNEEIPGCGHAWKDTVLLKALKGEHFVSSGF